VCRLRARDTHQNHAVRVATVGFSAAAFEGDERHGGAQCVCVPRPLVRRRAVREIFADRKCGAQVRLGAQVASRRKCFVSENGGWGKNFDIGLDMCVCVCVCARASSACAQTRTRKVASMLPPPAKELTSPTRGGRTGDGDGRALAEVSRQSAFFFASSFPRGRQGRQGERRRTFPLAHTDGVGAHDGGGSRH
jgi:hypothetical protein